MFKDKLKKNIQINQPLIYIRGNDELRVIEICKRCCEDKDIGKKFEIKDYIDFAVETGNIGQGIINFIEDNKNESKVVFITSGMQFLQPQELTALISRIGRENINISIVVMSESINIPPVLSPYTTVIQLPAPSNNEIEKFCKSNGLNSQRAKEIAPKLKGLTFFEIKQILKTGYADNTSSNINTPKRENDSNNEYLSFVSVGNEELGGFKKLRENLESEKNIFLNLENAMKNNVPIPKGFLLVGIPGCGKSLAAKVTAKEFGIPLLKMEFGKIMNKYVGESEANLFHALKFAEESAPCVLWLDEFEKTIVANADSGADGNISGRLLGIFLNWLQEKTAPIYIVATVNNIDKMPPELLRRGRFDEIFKVDFPNANDRYEIMKIHLNNYGISFNDEEMKCFCNKLDKYSGADIESLVKRVKQRAYCEKKSPDIDLFEQAKDDIKSVDVIMHEQVQKIKDVFKKYYFTSVD